MSVRLLLASIAASMGALALGFALRDALVFVPLFVVIGVVWIFGWYRQWYAFASTLAGVGLALVVGCAAIGLSINALPSLMLIAVIAALTAWDLTHFERRLRAGADKRVERADDIVRHHLQWLLIADACGLVVAGLALTIRTTFSFGVMFLLGLLAALVLSWTIGYLRRE